MDKIVLKNMEFYAYHGALPEEQILGQKFNIDVELYCSLEKAGETDNLNDTVSYAEIYDIIKNIVQNNKFRLIERLAHCISQEILSKYKKISEILVSIRKPQAPINGKFDWMCVEIRRKNNAIP